MRVSIWQQFSSNHSAGFSLVAQFKTVEETEKAAAIVRHFINTVAKWYQEHPELDDELIEEGILPLTPPEEQLAEQYDLQDWEWSLDWAPVEADETVSNQGFYIYENLIFLSDPIETWCVAQPFNDLLTKLGGIVKFHEFEDQKLAVLDISCNAPDDKSAAEIAHILSLSIDRGNGKSESAIQVPNLRLQQRGKVSYSESRIEFKKLPTIWGHRVTDFLPHLISYLESQGCKNFEFSISEIEIED